MTPTLDLFMMTFNAAKHYADATVLAAHLQVVLAKDASAPGKLPDLVVFSIQELAPLPQSFIGNRYLKPYYDKYDDALDEAVLNVVKDAGSKTNQGVLEVEQFLSQPRRYYTRVRALNVGTTALMLFARDTEMLCGVDVAECGFGTADLGNKGAVGIRIRMTTHSSGRVMTRSEMTFVATHLAAMEWNLDKRNANWARIVSDLQFDNPKAVLPGVFPPLDKSESRPDMTGTKQPPVDAEPAEAVFENEGSSAQSEHLELDDLVEDDNHKDEQPLLDGDRRRLSPRTVPTTSDKAKDKDLTRGLLAKKTFPPAHPDFPDLSIDELMALQNMSIFKSSSHLFIAGDLNYRIGNRTPPPLSIFPSFDQNSPNFFLKFLWRDQLTKERSEGRTLHGMTEAPIGFGPTYKFDKVAGGTQDANGPRTDGIGSEAIGEPMWKFSLHRWPSWTDRILYLETPIWARGETYEDRKVEITSYASMPLMHTSDHRPVLIRAKVPLIDEDEMRPPQKLLDNLASVPTCASAQEGALWKGGQDADSLAMARFLEEAVKDPRIALPFPMDINACQRREAARRKEIVIGYAALVGTSREGAMTIMFTICVIVASLLALRLW